MTFRARRTRLVLTVWLLAALTIGAPLARPTPVSAAPGPAVETGPLFALPASLGGGIDGPGHHFGFS